MDTPPYNDLMHKLHEDDIEGAVKLWTRYCSADGGCTRGYHKQTHPHIYCANMLHVGLLGKSMGGVDSNHEDYHKQAQKVQAWIVEQEA